MATALATDRVTHGHFAGDCSRYTRWARVGAPSVDARVEMPLFAWGCLSDARCTRGDACVVTPLYAWRRALQPLHGVALLLLHAWGCPCTRGDACFTRADAFAGTPLHASRMHSRVRMH